MLACFLPTCSDNRRKAISLKYIFLGSHCPHHISYSVWEPALKNTCSAGTWSEYSLTGGGCAGSKVALPVIQLIPKIFSKQCPIMAGKILPTETQNDPVHWADAFHQSIHWPAESLCFCTLILSRWVMTIMKEASIANPATSEDLGIFLVCYLYEHFYWCKMGYRVCSFFGKNTSARMYIKVWLCRDPLVTGPFSFGSPCFACMFFLLAQLLHRVVWTFLSFAGYSLPRGSDLWWCTPVLWASGVCCDNANHQCLHLHQQHSAVGYWHIPVFGQQSSRPRRQEYWSHWTYCPGCVYWYYGEGEWGEEGQGDLCAWLCIMNNTVLCAFEPADIPWWGMGCLVGTVGVCRAHRLHMQAVCSEV